MKKRLKEIILIGLLTLTLLFTIDLGLVLFFKPNGKHLANTYCEPELNLSKFCDFRPVLLAHYPYLYLAISKWIRGPSFKPIPLDEFDKTRARFEMKNFLKLFYRLDYSKPADFDESKVVNYLYSSDGYRIPSKDFKQDPNKNHFLAFFGGSFTHGEHLHFEETLPHFAQQLNSNSNAYNFGLGGRGLKEALLLTAYPSFFDAIKEDSGVFVYVYVDMHDERLYPTIHMAPQHTEHFLTTNKKEKILYAGYYFEALPGLASILSFIKFSGIGRLLNMHHKAWPSIDTNERMCLFVNHLRSRLKEIKPKSKFIVANYTNFKNHFVDCLRTSKIDHISPFIENPNALTRLPDWHPDANANKYLSQELQPLFERTFKEE